MTQTEVGDACNVTRQQWRRYEKNEQRLDGAVLRAFGAIGADEGYILFGMKTDAIFGLMQKRDELKDHEMKPDLEKLVQSWRNSEKEDWQLAVAVAQHLRYARLDAGQTGYEPSRAKAIKRLLAMSDADFLLVGG